MAITDEQKAKAEKLLLDGYAYQDIASKLGISQSSIQRIKKGLIENKPELVQTFNENKYNRFIQSREEKYLEKVDKEKNLFEDKEEGWVYHLTMDEIAHKESSKWWCFIVYPESASENWKTKLRALGCELGISPLHDKDAWEHDSEAVADEETGEIIEERGSRYKAGDKKKSHWHCIIKFDRAISFKEANNLIRPITNGPYLQKCMSLKGAYEYFIHLNNPERYQYEKCEIEVYNGFIIEPNAHDKIVMIDEIGIAIRKYNFTDLGQVQQHYEGQYEYINIIALKAFYFEKLTACNFRKEFPEGRTKKIKAEETIKVEIVQGTIGKE